MKQHFTMYRHLTVLFVLIAVLLAMLMTGCDERNEADRPPYKMIGQFATPAMAKDVVAKGDVAAVACGSYGTLVLNVRDASHMDTLSRDTVSLYSGAGMVALDTTNHLVATATDPKDLNSPFPLRDYSTQREWGQFAFSGPMSVYYTTSSRDTVTIWASDRGDGFVADRKIHQGDTAWVTDFEFSFPSFNPRTTNYVRGVARRSDGTLAMAVEEAGLHMHNEAGQSLADLPIPGIAWDCAWDGNNLVVASEIGIVMVNADDVRHPQVLSSLFINSADNMHRVAVDYPYALLMDIYDGVYVIDITDSRNMKYVQLLPLNHPTSMCFDHGRIYVTDEVAGLVVYSR